MSYLVIAATVTELAPFLAEIRNARKDGTSLPPVDVLISGIGLTSTSHSLTRQVLLKRPSLVIQVGIGGCFDTTMDLGEVCMVKQDTIADLGVVEDGVLKTIFDLSLGSPNKLPFQKGWLPNKSPLLKKSSLKKVKSISVNEITTQKRKIELFQEKFNPVLESMEGAALHYVCLSENIPFLQLRAASNYIGVRNKTKWMLQESIANVNQELIKLLNAL